MNLADERADPERLCDTPAVTAVTPGMPPGIEFDDDTALAYALQAAEIAHGSLPESDGEEKNSSDEEL